MSLCATRAARAAVLSGVVSSGAVLALPAASGSVIVMTGLMLATMTGWIVWQDVTDFTIPDEPLLVIGMLGMALRMSTADRIVGEVLPILLDAGLCGGALLAVREGYYRWKGVDGLGFADVKLAAAGGVLVGTANFALALLSASALGLAMVLVLLWGKPERRIDRLPFGAWLAPACAIVCAVSFVAEGR